MLEKQDKIAPTTEGDSGVEDVRAERAAWEAEKMTRRAALARVGLRFGAAALAAFTVDDLARATMRALDRHAQDGKIAGEVAREIRSAGVAFADPPIPKCVEGSPCQGCCDQFTRDRDACLASYAACLNEGKPVNVCNNAYDLCSGGAYTRNTNW